MVKWEGLWVHLHPALLCGCEQVPAPLGASVPSFMKEVYTNLPEHALGFS